MIVLITDPVDPYPPGQFWQPSFTLLFMKSKFKCFSNPTLVVRLFTELCEIFFPCRKKTGKKFLITDSGGSGDLTRPTHFFYFEEIEINTPITCLEWRGQKTPSLKSTLTKLEEIQCKIPAKDFSKLTIILIAEQQKRDRLENAQSNQMSHAA